MTSTSVFGGIGPQCMKVALYARVSTKDKGQDTENQLRELRQFAAASGWTITKEYIDHESAKSGDRNQFKALRADAGKRKFKAVLVWALDRFTREGIGPTFDYLRSLKASGVDFVSFTEPHFRTTGPVGDLMISIFAWIAEQERARISERTKAGLVTARAKGKTLGRPAKSIDIARAIMLRAEGKGVILIARALSAGGVSVSRELVRRSLAKEQN